MTVEELMSRIHDLLNDKAIKPDSEAFVAGCQSGSPIHTVDPYEDQGKLELWIEGDL